MKLKIAKILYKLKIFIGEEKNNNFPYTLSFLAIILSLIVSKITTNISLIHTISLGLFSFFTILMLGMYTLPRIDYISAEDDSALKKQIEKKMIEILKNGGNCLIATRDFTWGLKNKKSEIFKILKEKSLDRELTIAIPRKVYNKLKNDYKNNIDELDQAGAHIYKYPGSPIGHSFTITNYRTQGDQTIAIAQRYSSLRNEHIILYIDKKHNKHLFSVFTESVKAIVNE